MSTTIPNAENIFARYEALSQYVGWSVEDVARMRSAAPLVLPHLPAMVDDFYREIQRHSEARKVITGGEAQIQRLKNSLTDWLRELLAADYNQQYVQRRWQVGWRHVEIGLRQVFVNVAFSRLRANILNAIDRNYQGDSRERFAMELAVNRALDLDLAIIQDAYEAEKHLRSEAVFRNLVEAAGCAIVILRDDLTIAYFNPYAERVTGFAAPEVLGQSFSQRLLPAENHEQSAANLSRVIAGTPTWGDEIPVICRDGTRRTLVWNARRLDDFDGAPAVLAVGHDITELQIAQQRALQSQRLATIGQTMTGLAHESRNAFQRIQACLEMLQLEVDDRPEALELVQRIQRAQDHLHQLNEEVRNYAAPIRLERQTCDLVRLWRDTWDDLAVSRQDKSVILREEHGETDTTCTIDRFAIGQVLRNIFENAIAACPSEGVVEVNVKRVEGGANSSPALHITITDNGPGMNAEVRANIFEPFFTTKTKGTGLGMAIARRIIEAHGGEIHIGETTTGAEVHLALPYR